LVPYLEIATTKMKQDALFEHKEYEVTCEETMAYVKEYHKLFKPPKKPKKTLNNI
jgi:hypothetical protein